MSELSPKQTVSKMYEAVAAGEDDTVRALLHPEYRSHTQPHETSVDAFMAEMQAIRQVFTGAKREELLLMEEGDLAVVLQRVEGVHAETGEPIAYRSADFFRVASDGRLREHWDALTFNGGDMFDTIPLEA